MPSLPAGAHGVTSPALEVAWELAGDAETAASGGRGAASGGRGARAGTRAGR